MPRRSATESRAHHLVIDLGSDHYARNVNTESKKRNHIQQLELLG